MSTKFDEYSPSHLVSLLIKREDEAIKYDRLRDECLKDVTTIKALLMPLFSVGATKHFHGEYSHQIIVVRRSFAGLSAEKVELTWLCDLSFPEPHTSNGAPAAPVMAEAVTDDDDNDDDTN